MVVDISKMQDYSSPVTSALYPQLAVSLTAIGLILAVWFFIFEVSSAKKSRNYFKEFVFALASALSLGFGTVFLMLWVGIYV